MVSTFAAFPFSSGAHSLPTRPAPPYTAAGLTHRPASFAIQELLGLGNSPPSAFPGTTSVTQQVLPTTTCTYQRPSPVGAALPGPGTDTDYYLSFSSGGHLGYSGHSQARDMLYGHTATGLMENRHTQALPHPRDRISPHIEGKFI